MPMAPRELILKSTGRMPSPMTSPIRITIADDHELFRPGLRSLLLRHRDLQVVAEVESFAALKPTLDATPCDVLLLDLQMDKWVLGEVAEISRTTRVLIL